jgi:hypothetical protein
MQDKIHGYLDRDFLYLFTERVDRDKHRFTAAILLSPEKKDFDMMAIMP